MSNLKERVIVKNVIHTTLPSSVTLQSSGLVSLTAKAPAMRVKITRVTAAVADQT